MDVSLFKRLSERHPHAVVSLEHQYRMNQDIMELSNMLIYEHRLKCGTEGVARALLQLPNWDQLTSYVKENIADDTGTKGGGCDSGFISRLGKVWNFANRGEVWKI